MISKFCISVSLLSFVGGANAFVVDGKDCYQASALTKLSWNDLDAISDNAADDYDVAACVG